MKIAVCTIGSRGDIQPFLVLGHALACRGHEVKLATAEMYAPLAEGYAVEFTPFEGDYAALVDNKELKKAVGKNPFAIGKRLREMVYPVIESSLNTFFDTANWADAVVYHPKTLIDVFGVLYPHKLIKAYVVPAFTPTTAFPSPIFSSFWIPRSLNKSTYRLTNALISTVKGPIRSFCSQHNLPFRFKLLNTPVLYGISQHFMAMPNDYPANHHFTGFWFDSSTAELPYRTTSFFNTEKKKLIITFGSMPYKCKTDIDELISAIRSKIDIAVCLIKGWGLKDAPIDEGTDVLAVDAAPFDRLFLLADAVVHHGGAGTTAIALRSGCPMMICPVLHPIGDQMFWGRKVFETGLGVSPVPLSKLTVSRFVFSVTELLTRDFSDASLRMQEKLAAEDGLKTAVEIIEQLAQGNTATRTPELKRSALQNIAYVRS